MVRSFGQLPPAGDKLSIGKFQKTIRAFDGSRG